MLQSEHQKHQKIRFRRAEISNLAAFPSAKGQRSHWMYHHTRRHTLRAALFVGGVACVAILLVLSAGILVASSGWGTEALRQRAESIIERIAGGRAVASVGPAQVTLGAAQPLALQLTEISLTNAASRDVIADIGRVDFGVRMLPLLSGDFRLGSASVSDAKITTSAIPSMGGSDWTRTLRDERGLIDPDLVAAAAFKPLHALFDAIDAGFLAEVDLSNIEIVLPEGREARLIRIAEGSLSRAGGDELRIAVEAEVDGRKISLAGMTIREPQSGRIREVDLKVAADAPSQSPGEPVSAGRLGPLSLSITGAEEVGLRAQRLKVSAAVEDSVLDFGARGAFAGRLMLDAVLQTGSRKVEVERLLVETGRNSLEFNGAVGPRPAGDRGDDRPAYRYELLSTRTALAPEGSPEPALDFIAQVEGTFDPSSRVLAADRIAIRSGAGAVVGKANVALVAGKAPGVSLDVSVHKVDVSHAKQLWPWFAASGPRGWVLANVFGGKVREATIAFKVEPGRLGNGVPLSPEEISGRFVVEQTRFDTYGTLPAVREADGLVEVRGRDVDITMSRGKVYLPSGRVLSGHSGTLAIRGERRGIGKLDVMVEGEAGAVLEYAAYPPFNVTRVVQMEPADATGAVEGHVIADIPLQRGIDGGALEWIVSLDYENLSLAKPFGGQVLSKADGHITVEPRQAVISAKGLLNDVPAEIDMVEPLRKEGGPQRSRIVELDLDDKARDSIVPGLKQLLSGPAKVRVEEKGDARTVSADLTRSRLDLPWAGWSKGPGVPASADFVMRTAGGSLRISNFRLKGETFEIAGEMALTEGDLSSARFDTARLNRGDDVRVSIDRRGKAYAIGIRGSSLDGRSAIRTYLSDTGSNGGGTSGHAVDLAVDRVQGFNGERLSGVKLESKGSRVSISGQSASGAEFAFTNGTQDGRRQLRMQSADAGAILRFLDLYPHMEGGTIRLALAGDGDGGMSGQVDARDFVIADEKRLASIVSTAPAGGDRSLNEAVRKEIDTSRVVFERGYAQIRRGGGALEIANGVVRGPLIGSTFQGTLYDRAGNMDMTGTFMPAYGLNRIFGELPFVGEILGNGRDRGLIGVTFKLDGAAKSPRLQLNPLSVIAPGIFRSIFEFN